MTRLALQVPVTFMNKRNIRIEKPIISEFEKSPEAPKEKAGLPFFFYLLLVLSFLLPVMTLGVVYLTR